MPCGDPGHLDLWSAGGAGTDDVDRPARASFDDRQRQWTEFTSTAILAWSQDHAVAWHYIAPGKPTQNGFVESFNGRMRDELLNESLFFDLGHAREKLAAWADDYNTSRPHSSIGYLTPAAYAASLTATGRPAARLESCAARPVAHTALRSVTNAGTQVAAG